MKDYLKNFSGYKPRIAYIKPEVLIKFFLIVLFTFITGIHTKNWPAILLSIMELFLVFCFSDIISKKSPVLAYSINCLLCFVFLVQQGSLYYSGGYLSLLMLYNINAYNALGTALSAYFLFTIIILTVSFFPYKYQLTKASVKLFLIFGPIFIFLSFVFYNLNHDVYSPYLSLARTSVQAIKAKIRNDRLRHFDNDRILPKFYKETITRGEILQKTPPPPPSNIIVIFAEGMSAEVIDEFNNLNLNLTPNLNKLYRSSFVFKNYYNHTAATFRGLRGQLFSSYQYLGGYYSDGTGFGEIDKAELIKRTDTRLISIIDILKGAGYETSFINTEPSNVQFSNYLETFHFDKILSGDVMDRYLTDKEAFHLLKDTVFDLEEPFFIGMYNIGTHHGYDSPDKKYGNGDNPVLNKFFNYDTWFGDFFNCLLETDIFDNTMLIFTTDHASFNSPEYIHTFNSNQKYFVNTIPLFIYWNGMDHTIADANGRNSLDLAPTILDLLGIYNHRNYFLGSSLFTESIGDFNRISAIGDEFYYSGTKGIVPIRKDHKNEIELIYQYYGISMNYD